MPDFALRELIDIVGGRFNFGTMPPLAGEASPLGRIVTDSRLVKPDDVFWAMAGPQHDGADFVDEAFARGASGVVVAGRNVEPWAGRWSLHVEETQWALWQLAEATRARFDGQVIAVTGSIGKTTARQMIDAVLGSRFQGTSRLHNDNLPLGVPLSILSWDDDQDYAVVELGASHRGEIAALAGLCAPHVGVITCVAEAHLDKFGSQQAIAESKAELLDALREDGWSVLNRDDLWLCRLADRCQAKIIWVGRSADADVVATDVRSGDGQLRFCTEGQEFCVPVWGRHDLTSALTAIAVGRVMQISMDQIAASLAEFQPPPQRCQITKIQDKTIINDSYNACPTAMRAALELLRDFNAPGRRIVVCGDMRELGPSAEYWHRQLGDQVVTVCGADMLVTCGDHARDVVTGARDAGMPVGQAIACSSPQDVLSVLGKELAPGDVVLIKASRSLAVEKLIAALDATNVKQAA